MHNKKTCKIQDIKTSLATNLLLADENNPSLELKDANLKWCLFLRLGMKDGRIHDCIFRHCIFEDCYFRNVRFRNVNFTGSFFKNCNLTKATFEACCFWYVQFSRCSINYDEVLQSLPSESNIAVPLLRSLRQNALEMGEKRIADKILLREIEIEKQELKNQFYSRTEYYKSRYKPIERLLSGVKFLGLWINGFIWGYGLKLQNLLLSAFVCILIFSSLLLIFGQFVISENPNVAVKLNFGRSLYLSIVTFTTLGCGDFTPASIFTHVVCAAESFFGVIFLGFLAAAVYRKFAR